MNKIEFGIMAVFIVAMTQVASASALVINPSDDGSVYLDGGVLTNCYLTACEPTRGVVEFPTSQILWPISTAYLSVNPYGLPLWSKTVQIYGYGSSDGQLTSSDYDAGNYLGVLILPEDLGYGEDALFEVTSFMQGVSTPFVGFNIRSEYAKTDIFSSLEYNEGHSAQLLVSPIPEPSTIILILAGLPLLGFRKNHGS
ncbi:MAG: PEP-CTERM sorting domain-containing protein [Candidatus Omnitrophota bacterium]